MKGNVFDFLNERGFVYQSTDSDGVRKLLSGDKPVTFYLGIDPTADSLHIGHFFALRMFRYLQDAGHRGILLVGNATARIGDPSGKSDMRKMLAGESVDDNMNRIKSLVSKFIVTEGPNACSVHGNMEWMDGYGYIDFMRDIGMHFNVNQMLAAEAYSARIKEGGLTFLEMGYMLMQAYDFVHLNRKFGCRLQIGGSDQWGNITAGTMLNRKLNGSNCDDIYGLTSPLLLTKDGKKMGKTEKGTLWVVGDRTSPFDFYQYFYNIEDESVEKLLKLFTEMELKEISSMVGKDILLAKRTMAYEVTKLVHGKTEADKVVDAVTALFKTGASNANIPSVKVDFSAFDDDNVLLVDLMTSVGFMPSKSEARRMILQSAVSVSSVKVTDVSHSIDRRKLKSGDEMLLQRGKKNFLKVIVV